MNLEFCLFYLFSSFILVSSIMVISLRNAVHSVLFLIITFCNTIALFLLIGAEFLSFLFLIVYVGAIAVLFLFVIMMLNIKFLIYKVNIWSVIPIGIILTLNFILQTIIVVNYNLEFIKFQKIPILSWYNWVAENIILANLQVIGETLYTKYGILFIICGISLFISMIGVIVLTLHRRSSVKTQLINAQLNRLSLNSIKQLHLKK